MKKELTLKDQLAMSMAHDSIPTLNNEYTRTEVFNHFGIEFDDKDPISMIKASLTYEAIIRYMYADQMLIFREA